MTVALYAGSFDPITMGHIHIIEQCVTTCDKVIIAIGTNPQKRDKYCFTAEERKQIIFDFITSYGLPNIDVITFENIYLVDVAHRYSVTHIVRGIRNAVDCEKEMADAQISMDIWNRKYNTFAFQGYPAPVTLFIPTPPKLAQVSSSMVKSLIGYAGWREQIGQYLPPSATTALMKKFANV